MRGRRAVFWRFLLSWVALISLSVIAHLEGGGSIPVVGVVVLAALSVGPTRWLASRPRPVWILGPALGLIQSGWHVGLSWIGHPESAPVAVAPGLHQHAAGAALLTLPRHGSGEPTASMLLTHMIAGLLIATWLRCGEQALSWLVERILGPQLWRSPATNLPVRSRHRAWRPVRPDLAGSSINRLPWRRGPPLEAGF